MIGDCVTGRRGRIRRDGDLHNGDDPIQPPADDDGINSRADKTVAGENGEFKD